MVAFTIAIGGTAGAARRSRTAPTRARRPSCSSPSTARQRRPRRRRHRRAGRRRRPTATRRHARAARSRCASRTRPGTRAPAPSASPPASGCGTRPPARYLLPRPAARRRRTPAARGARRAARVLQRRLPLARAAARRSRDPPDTCSTSPAWWRDRAAGRRARAPATSAPFHADVDFGKLAAGTTTTTAAACRRPARSTASSPATSRPQQGVDYSTTLLRRAPAHCQGELPRAAPALRDLRARSKPLPAAGYGLTLLLHSLGANYNQFLGSRNQSQFGERGPGSIVITPRGPRPRRLLRRATPAPTCSRCGPTSRATTGSTPTGPSITGYSMGGFGTFKLADAVPRPVRPRPADGRRQRGQQHGRLAAQHPGPDVERGHATSWSRRGHAASTAHGARRGSATATSSTSSAGRAPHARDQRPVRARGRLPRHARGRPQPGARHLRRATRAWTSPNARTSSPTTPTGSRACRPRGARPGHRRRALARLRRRRPRRVGDRSSAPAR